MELFLPMPSRLSQNNYRSLFKIFFESTPRMRRRIHHLPALVLQVVDVPLLVLEVPPHKKNIPREERLWRSRMLKIILFRCLSSRTMGPFLPTPSLSQNNWRLFKIFFGSTPLTIRIMHPLLVLLQVEDVPLLVLEVPPHKKNIPREERLWRSRMLKIILFRSLSSQTMGLFMLLLQETNLPSRNLQDQYHCPGPFEKPTTRAKCLMQNK
mmetsp:Transcript_34084/g.62733  ORF Transcript_34084/g.62733 Transcript_34084/m.62733 type:complete len:210 (-) Transcript_34084:2296-2925(-)